jgi:hypothetical protein
VAEFKVCPGIYLYGVKKKHEKSQSGQPVPPEYEAGVLTIINVDIRCSLVATLFVCAYVSAFQSTLFYAM